MKHRQSPKIARPASMIVQATLDYVPYRCKIRATMCVHHTFRFRRRPTRKRYRNHGILVVALRFQPLPSLSPLFHIILQSFKHSLVKWSRQCTTNRIRIGVDYELYPRLCLAEIFQQRLWTSAMPVLIPRPPVGGKVCAASPARNIRNVSSAYEDAILGSVYHRLAETTS